MIQIKEIDEKSFAEVSEAYNVYRIFYGQKSDIKLATTFIYERMKNNDSVIFAAHEMGRVVGFMQLFVNFSTVKALKRFLIADLFVYEHTRKKGIATALINKAKEYAIENGGKTILLATERDNHLAKKLYHKMGFNLRDTARFLNYELTL